MFGEIKAWLTAIFLKNYNRPDQQKPRNYPESRGDVREWHLIDRYSERNSDPETQAINEKVLETVARLKAQGKF